jgi:hypothetical protein
MNLSKEELQERAQLVRIHEANCAIEHPSEQEMSFRLAIMKRIAVDYGLKELRTASMTPSPAPKARG